MKAINDRFGTHRGLARLILSRAAYVTGQYTEYENVDWRRVERLVAVCWGNICRSPFADVYARRRAPNSVSIGLSIVTGQGADPTAINVAEKLGVDLKNHRATSIDDFEMQRGDLYLLMEDRHAEHMAPLVKSAGGQMALLGLWCEPKFPLIYDPKSNSPEYFEICYKRMQGAIDRLIDDWEANRSIREET